AMGRIGRGAVKKVPSGRIANRSLLNDAANSTLAAYGRSPKGGGRRACTLRRRTMVECAAAAPPAGQIACSVFNRTALDGPDRGRGAPALIALPSGDKRAACRTPRVRPPCR